MLTASLLTRRLTSRRPAGFPSRHAIAQQRFLADAAHQLRTPIAIALGHAELLAATTPLALGPAQDLQIILGELTRLRRIAERLLLIAAAEEPGFLRPGPLDLAGFITDAVRRWRPTEARQWRLGRLDKVTVWADEERLTLAVDALLENAVQHTAPGDVIQLAVVAGPGSSAAIIVRDSGTGIPADLQPHVFDRFRTGASSGTGRQEPGRRAAHREPGRGTGTGLGLALVRAVASAHGGQVSVRSEAGGGSEFELLLAGPGDRENDKEAASSWRSRNGRSRNGGNGHGPGRRPPWRYVTH